MSYKGSAIRLLTYHVAPNKCIKKTYIIKQILFNNGYYYKSVDKLVRKIKGK